MLELTGKHSTAKVFTDNIDGKTIGQIIEILNQPFTLNSKVRIMPDTHAGKGCVIGTTMTVTDKIVPNLVGVDIGCGVLAYEVETLNFDIKNQDDLKLLDDTVKALIPSGRDIRDKAHKYSKRFNFNDFIAPVNDSLAPLGLGTLGGGNHFIELNYSETTGKTYLVVHSGSRYVGVKVATYHQKQAVKNLYQRDYAKMLNALKEQNRHQEISSAIEAFKNSYSPEVPDHVAYLEGQPMQDYLHDLNLAQEYAELNRELMLDLIVDKLGWKVTDTIHSVHNYIDMDDMVLRKGATKSLAGEKLVIPINMRDGSIIARGKSNEDWNNSAPHGAGRLLSRSSAKSQLDLDTVLEQMDGIFTTSLHQSTLDEAPDAYKPLDEIIENTRETIDIIEVVKPVYNFKASE